LSFEAFNKYESYFLISHIIIMIKNMYMYFFIKNTRYAFI